MRKSIGSFVAVNRRGLLLLGVLLSMAVFGIVTWRINAQSRGERAVGPLAKQSAPSTRPPQEDVVPDKIAGQTPSCTFHVLIAYADTGAPTGFQSEILAEPGVTGVDLFNAEIGTPTLAQLQQYNIVVPMSNSTFLDGDTLGNNLADYVDGGGIVVQYGFSHFGPGQPYGVNGRWLTGNYNPYNYSTNLPFVPFTLGTFNAGHPLMAGVTTLNSDFQNGVTLAAGATEVAAASNGNSLVAYRPVSGGHTTVGVTGYVGAAATQSGHWGRVVINAGKWLLTCGSQANCNQNFDGFTAPALPPGWTTSHIGAEVNWVTSTTNPDTAPNDVFAPDVTDIGYTQLISPNFVVAAGGSTMSFRNLYNLEAGFDGMVLEISTNGSPYQDILAAGGSFVTGGYNGTIGSPSNPLVGRQAWTGLSGGTTAVPTYITTTVQLPASANGQIVQMKWRVATDNNSAAPGASGARIDTITGISCSATAANVSISGRVLTPDGRGLRNARVVITDSQGVTRTVTTSSFGFFQFDDVASGRNYVIGVISKQYRFASRAIQVNDTMTDVDFVGLE